MVSEQKLFTMDLGKLNDIAEYVSIVEKTFEERMKKAFEFVKYGSPPFKLLVNLHKRIGANISLTNFNRAFSTNAATDTQVYDAEVGTLTEGHKWTVFKRLLKLSCRVSSATPEEVLKKLKKEKGETWTDFVDRYVTAAIDSTADEKQQTRILYQKLPAKWRTVLADLNSDCNIMSMVNRIRNYAYWEGLDTRHENEDFMDIDAVREIQEFRAEAPAKVISNGRINYDAINSPGRVMVGAREICKNSRKEAWNLLRYLQRLLEQDRPQNRQRNFQNRRPPQGRRPQRTYEAAVETCKTDEGPSHLGEITDEFEEASEESFPVNAVKTSKKQKGVMKLPINAASHLGYDRKIEGLVDTGAEKSVISLDLVKEIGLNIKKDESKLVFANGESSKVVGKCTLKFRTSSTRTGQLKVDCLILPKPGYELLIGMDFLKSQDISINPASHTLTMNKATIKCYSAKNISRISVKNSVVEDVIGTFTEKATHLPVVKENKVAFPLNRSVVLGPKEIRMIKYPAVLSQKLTHKKSAIITPNFSVHIGTQLKDFTIFSLTNHKQEPIKLTPKTTIFEAPLLQGQNPVVISQDGARITLKPSGRKQPFQTRQ